MLKKSKNKSRGCKNLIAYRHKKLLQLGKYSFKGVTMRHFFANLVCAFIPQRTLRNKVRTLLYYPVTRDYIGFVRNYARSHHMKQCKIKIKVGWICCNLVVILNNKYVFKFPLKNDGKELAAREKRITDALRPISPIKIPKMEILDFNGMAVRKYECIKGIGFHSLSRTVQNQYADKIAKQLAKFLYVVGCADPKAIRHLKNKKSDSPSIMHGWNQNDLWDNFIMNPKTFDIVGIIDWEEAGFNDFYNCFVGGTRNNVVKGALLREYMKLYLHEQMQLIK